MNPILWRQRNIADLRLVKAQFETHQLRALAKRIANLNPRVPEIGAGMLNQLVTTARQLTE